MFHTPFHKVAPHLPQAGQIVDDPRVSDVPSANDLKELELERQFESLHIYLTSKEVA